MQAAYPPILERLAARAELLDGVEVDLEDVRASAAMCRELWGKLGGSM